MRVFDKPYILYQVYPYGDINSLQKEDALVDNGFYITGNKTLFDAYSRG